ncbi:urease accessory protein UreD [Nocardia seriolae]|nr:urease accessory protein UreD [Nocardia seriolae]WNJ62336.1 urease accessory protein UreD [Nocardia seriolae]BAW06824.1 urease accessory protein UreD [Nocardia seriolae]BEK88592.1 urease accessory protein UreD [Nocardia seriolae]BEK96344.1 urease accessory protein UreD [Nocardia seriolae]GEM22236.1 putative urease accessory protein [Nocardia seriolae NBRC 15557]
MPIRTELRITATAGTLPHIHAVGGLAARRTGIDTVHFIGTAATPLGGDVLDIVVSVGEGARLTVRSVAATIALPGRETRKSVAHWRFEVAAGGELNFDPEPTVVAGGAEHETFTAVTLEDGARLRLRERVQIGRTGEDHGYWSGELTADVGPTPLLRHRLELGSDAVTDDALSAPRALESVLTYPDERQSETVGLDAALLPLAAGGTLFTRTARLLMA